MQIANSRPVTQSSAMQLPHLFLLRRLVPAFLLALSAACAGGDARAADSLPPPSDTLSDSLLIARADRGRTMGSDSAPIWIVMFSDYQCPYCRQFHDDPLRLVVENYVNTGKARFAYLHLPLPNHPHARPAARASLCASAQGKFWEYSDSVFNAQPRLRAMADASPLLVGIAGKIGLDMQAFAHCQRSNVVERMVQSDEQQAEMAGVRSTPSFFVGDFLVQGMAPYDDFRRAVDTALFVAAKKRKH